MRPEPGHDAPAPVAADRDLSTYPERPRDMNTVASIRDAGTSKDAGARYRGYSCEMRKTFHERGPCEVTEMGLGNGMLSSPGSAPIPADAEAIAGPLRSSWSAGAHSQAPVYPPGIVRNEGLLSI